MRCARRGVRRTALAVATLIVTTLGVPAVAGADVGSAPPPVPSCPTAYPLDSSAADLVALVRPPRLGANRPTGATNDAIRQALLTADRYALGTQFAAAYALRAAPYVELRYDAWGQRPPTTEAMGLAISTETGAYDAAAVGRPIETARAVALWLVRSVACQYRTNSPGGWGYTWQSPYYAAQAGLAGWLLWPYLDDTDRAYVARMVVTEADKMLTFPPPYYATPDGLILTPGDTRGEEDAWMATVLALAAAMMPTHPHRDAWMRQNVWFKLASFSTPSDLMDTTPIHGAPLSQWLSGWNAYDDGTIINHDRIHPDYMATVAWNVSDVLVDGLAGLPVPKAAFHHFDLVYDALQHRQFDSPPFDAPGGTIYRPGSGDIYYPQGDDWGTQRVVQFAYADDIAAAYGSDPATAQTWEQLHLDRHLALAARTDDGRSFVDPSTENSMPDPEQWVSEYAGRAWLFSYVLANGGVSVSDENLYSVGSSTTPLAPHAQSIPTPEAESHVPVPPNRVAPPPGGGVLDAAAMLRSSGVMRASAVVHLSGHAVTLVDDTGDEAGLDLKSARDPSADITDMTLDAGDTVGLGVDLAAPPLPGSDVTATWNLDTGGDSAAEAVVTLRLPPGGTPTADVIRVADGRRLCAGTPTVAGAELSVSVPATCLGSPTSIWSDAAVVTVLPDDGTGRHVVADAVSAPGCRVPMPGSTATATGVRPAAAWSGQALHVAAVVSGAVWDVTTTAKDTSYQYVGGPVAGGGVVGGPAMVSGPSGTLVLVARTSDGRTWTRRFDGTKWVGGWLSWGGFTRSDPGVSVLPDGTVTVYVRGSDANLYRRTWPRGVGMKPWQRIGARLASGPVVAVDGTSQYVFVTAVGGGVYRTTCSATTCARWVSLGGSARGEPAVTRLGPGALQVAATRSDGTVAAGTYSLGGWWSGWRSVGGLAVSPPAITSRGDFVSDVVVTWASGQTCRATQQQAVWGAWQHLGS